MHLIPHDPTTKTPALPTSSSDLPVTVRAQASPFGTAARSGVADDVDLDRRIREALVQSPLPTASTVGSDREERRRRQISALHIMDSARPLVIARNSLQGFVAGSFTGVGLLLARNYFFNRSNSRRHV